MHKNFALAGISGVVVLGAVLGVGWLALRGSPAVKRTPPALPAVAPKTQPKKSVPPPPKAVRRSDPAPAAVAPQPAPAASTDVCAEVQELLREYDRIILDPSPGLADSDRTKTLRERTLRIDKVIADLAALGPDAIPCLADAFRGDARGNAVARESIEVRAIAKIPACKEAAAALGDAYLATDNWGVRMTVIAQLADMKVPGSLPEMSCQEAVDWLCARVEQDQDFRIRGSILKYLAMKKAPCGIAAAQRIAVQDDNPNVRIAAVRALAEAEDLSSRLVLEDRARADGDITVRQSAIQAYAQLLKESGLALLEDLLQHDPNFKIKATVILALQQMGGDAARQVLQRASQDASASEDVRARATGALAALDRFEQNGGPVMRPRLEGLQPARMEGMRPLGPIGGGPAPAPANTDAQPPGR